MKYGLILKPTDNLRYYSAIKKLSLSELTIMSQTLSCPISDIDIIDLSGLSIITFIGDISEQDREILLNLSAVMAVCEINDGLKVFNELPKRYLGEDLPGILKYKGKTNPVFTALMLNIAMANIDMKKVQKLTVFDPMCGRGTSLFVAATRGYDCIGIDNDKKNIDELEKYYLRYLKQNRYKHRISRVAVTMDGMPRGQRYSITSAKSKEEFKANNTHKMMYCKGDTIKSDILLKGERADVLIVDLPYGIQHSGHGEVLSSMVKNAAKSWKRILKVGGCGVIAYNCNGLSKEKISGCFEGYEIIRGGVYDGGFEHSVEQGIKRDILVVRNT